MATARASQLTADGAHRQAALMQPPPFAAAPTGGGGSPRTDEGTGWRAQRVVRARPSKALFARPPGGICGLAAD